MEKTIEELIRRVQEVDVGLSKEIIIVDDGSTDGIQEILKSLKQPHIKVIYHNTNQGKGATLHSGFSEAEGDIILVQDAVLEYNPKEDPHLLEPILDGRADAVYGSRFLGGPHRVLYFWHYVGNNFLTAFSNMLSNLNLSDMETRYKVFKKDVLGRITLKSKRLWFEPEITLKLARLKARIYKVPISYSGRDYSDIPLLFCS